MSTRPLLLALSLLLVAAGSARAEDYEAAGKRFALAQAAYEKGSYVKAAEEYEAAWQISKDPALFENIGDSWNKAKDPRRAVKFYRLYLENQPHASDRAAVEKRLHELEVKHHIAPEPIKPAAEPHLGNTGLTLPPSKEPEQPPQNPNSPPGTPQNPQQPPGTPQNPQQPPGTPQNPQQPPGTPMNPQQPPGTPMNPLQPPGTPQNPLQPPGTPQNPQQPNGTPQNPLQPAGTPDNPQQPPSPIDTPPLVPPPAATTPPVVVETPPSATTPPTPVPGGLIDEDHPTKLRIAAWVSVAATVALVAAGAICGLAAQERADEITREQVTLDPTGQPAGYDAATATRYHQLESEGRLYNGFAVGLLAGAGATAITSITLFILDHRATQKAKTVPPIVQLAPTFSPRGGGLSAAFEF